VLRDRLHGMIRRFGAPRLHRWLCGLDPRSAARLLPRDSHRIVRALEFVIGNGTAWSTRLELEGTWQSAIERFRTLKIGLDMDRVRLRERLDRRVDHFFEAGLVEEVKELLSRGVPETANAFKAIGYREIVQALASGASPAAAAGAVKVNTWRYSKRQRTWFRREPGVVWLDVESGLDQLVEQTIAHWKDGSAQNREPKT
jgi:tRNA dimethylallyltransferase